MAHFGLDIGSDSIKIVQLAKKEGKYELVGAGMTKNPVGSLSSEAEADHLKIAEAIKKVKKEAGIITTEVVCALPEDSVFTRVIELPKMEESEVDQALKWELEETVPFPLADANYDWEIVGRYPSKISVLVAVAPRKLVEKYLHLCDLAGLQPVAFETEVLSLVRPLANLMPEKTKIVVELGAKSTDIIVLKGTQVFSTRSLPSAGAAITRAIADDLSLEGGVAEEYKKTYGLAKDQFEGKVAEVIYPVSKLIMTEIKKTADFVKEGTNEEVRLVVLVGGTANLPGFLETLTQEFGFEVVMGDPFSLIGCDEKTVIPLKKVSPNFVVAVGLAMKEV